MTTLPIMKAHATGVTTTHQHIAAVDGEAIDKVGEEEKVLQIFTDTVIGPLFFEIIQRKGNEGFGEGNFQALFDSIEQDQKERGVI